MTTAIRLVLIVSVILMQCGDIESNPGPPKPQTRQAKLSVTGDILRDTDDVDNTKLAQMIANLGDTMKSDTQSIRQDIHSLKGSFDQYKKETDKKVNDLNKEVGKLKQENDSLKSALNRIDEERRRKNLIFYDIPEARKGEFETKQDLETAIKTRLIDEDILNEDQNQHILIGTSRRLGRWEADKNRPVLCEFIHEGDKDNILKKHRALRKEEKSSLKISEDYTDETRLRRKLLGPLLEPLRNMYPEETKIYISYDKLVVGKKRYTTKDVPKLKQKLAKHSNQEGNAQAEESSETVESR